MTPHTITPRTKREAEERIEKLLAETPEKDSVEAALVETNLVRLKGFIAGWDAYHEFFPGSAGPKVES